MRSIQGKKIGKDGMYPDAVESKGDVIYPTFYISIKDLPEAKDWKIGGVYDVTLRLKQTGVNIHKHEGKKEDYGDASFEIHGIQTHGEVKKKVKKAPVKKKEKYYSRIKK